ncbi:MAG: HAD-IA family hydrolase [Oscillospiraceae bacterium]|jgi:phosphoglycolate phosphatase|nr:HAD-IA family hydrolase [Oscillospiraceae bacterium]
MTKLKYSAVLFDLDGTILDTLGDTAATVNHMLQKLGFADKTHAEVSANMGRGIGNLVRKSLPDGADDALFARAVEIYREYYARHWCDTSKPYDGVLDMLAALKNAGAATAVISNKSEEYTKIIVDKLFAGYIDVAVGELPGFPLKPDPAPVLKALAQLGVGADSAAYVGDTEVDMQTAKNSGTACVTCAWGLRGRETLLASGADALFMADTPADVFRILSGGAR